jgi:FkbM family methyltransferase
MLRLTGIRGVLTLRPLPKFLLFILSKINIILNKEYVKLKLKGYHFPLFYRYNTSDQGIFYQIFLLEEYSCLNDLPEPKLIIDAGANVGFSSIYFLNKYPNAHVIAVEPDDENFKLCEKNLSFYSERVSLIKSGIWSHQTGLIVFNDKNNESAIQVKECQSGEEADIYAIDIDNLLNNSAFTSIDLLKMDIEGSEAVVFSEKDAKWLTKVRNIVIELHGKECEQQFFEALSTYDYDLSKYGELTVCKRLSPKITNLNSTVCH